MNDDILNPIQFDEVLKTLEYYGICQKFECIKCKETFGTINLALQHLRAGCTPTKNYIPNVELLNKNQIKEIKKFIPRKTYTKRINVRSKHSTYSEEDKHYILSSTQGSGFLASRFNTTKINISKLKYRWRKKLKPIELKKLKEERKIKGNLNSNYKYQKHPSTDYKVESADEK